MNIFAKLAATALVALPSLAFAFEGQELYPGERALYEAAQKEGLVVSFDTGPTWANWKAWFSMPPRLSGRNVRAIIRTRMSEFPPPYPVPLVRRACVCSCLS